MHYRLLLLLWITQRVVTQANDDFDVLDFIDPLIGSNNGGNVFCGATLPYGMAKASADVDGQNTGGFSTDGSNVIGFSSLHDSGTGGNPSLGNFPLFPQLCPENDIDNCLFSKQARATPYVNDSVVARPGYFALTLQNGIYAEMTVSKHTALYNFRFPDASTSGGDQVVPMILLDLTDLWDSRQNATFEVQDSRMTGNGTFLPSFGAGSYEVHFCVDFFGHVDSVYDSGVWVNERGGVDQKSIFVTRGFNNFYLQAGGFARFQAGANRTITARVGVSFVSVEKACANAQAEIPRPLSDFNSTRKTVEDAWREKLSPLTLEVGDVGRDLQTNFWSSLYRTMISPQDYTGENPRWNSSVYYDSFYCLWDQFRSQLPMLTILDPVTYSDMLKSLLFTFQNEGWLPDCRMSLSKGWTQGGSNADVVLVDAYFKNVTGIDWDTAWEAVVNDAENEPLEWSKEGRGGLVSWKKLGYIPALDFDYLGFGTNSRSISRTLEYSYNDFCIGAFGRSSGKEGYETYLARGNNWKNLFKEDQTSVINGTDPGFVGFFQPNFVPHDIETLISKFGGDQRFVDRLDYFHESPLVDIGNEPVFLSVFQYHYAGRPGLSSRRSHYYIPSRFNTSYSGLPGNDDSGAMGSFAAFNMMGLFPNPGQNVYLIIPPYFPSVQVRHPLTNRTATIRTENFDSAYVNVFIQNATLNGEPYTKNWIGHEFFTQGGELVLTLGSEESSWGRAVEDRPPSETGGDQNAEATWEGSF
ncbi:Six-hairpin glycosidase-like protein [Lasiodiplodia theobromae]|uniref:Six-hairpin glycosidase-like protein n=1 Tax=Lasiodiplodia theobromae TaxID=45133 RepID=A0A8H7IS36_9PEZI|nr:Six-hairpin glycosidase-like protein [Lasiodiplodia theobromae]